MKKTLTIAAVAALLCANAFATYIVVLRNGTQYKAKAKWTVVKGKAMVSLESGQTLQLDPSLIDEAKSEQATRLGLGDARLLDLDPNVPSTAPAKRQSLGDTIHLRKPPAGAPAAPPAQAQPSAPAPATVPATAGAGSLSDEVADKFARAYENVGIFEQKITKTGPHSLRADLTADSEDKVFNAISATSFLMVRNAGVSGAQIDLVEIFMKTTTGGASGRFKMTREDATALDKKQISQQDYFVHNVLF